VEDAVAFLADPLAGQGVVGSLLGAGDLVLHSGLAQNVILYSAELGGAERLAFPHNDWRSLDRLLTEKRKDYRRVLIAVEGLSATYGDYPDLPEFIATKRRHRAMLLVDESHSLGVLGEHGRGLAEHFGLRPRDVEFWVGSLGATLAASGSYLAGSRQLGEFLRSADGGMACSGGMAARIASAARAALRLLEEEPERVAQLQASSRLFAQRARQRGLNTANNSGAPLVPVVVGDEGHALELAARLAQRGLRVQPVLSARGDDPQARVRFFVTAMHTDEQIRRAIDVTVEELTAIAPGQLTPRRGTRGRRRASADSTSGQSV
jgi:7-keto-8-aminopelargonate synthetase-like enzyme